MTIPSSTLPSDGLIRPARLKDFWVVQRLILELDRSIWLKISNRSRHNVNPFDPYLVTIVIALLVIALRYSNRYLLILAILLTLPSLASLSTTATKLPKTWVLEVQKQVVAIAMLYTYGDHSELYGVCVLSSHRHKGRGTALVKGLIQQATLPLYLACQPDVVEFYTRLGFTQLLPEALPEEVFDRLGIKQFQQYGIVPLILQQGNEKIN